MNKELVQRILNKHEIGDLNYLLEDRVLECRSIAELKKEKLKKLRLNLSDDIKMVIIQIGNDYGSDRYTEAIIKICVELNIHVTVINKEETSTESEIIAIVQEMNSYKSVSGIMIQTPLPKHIRLTELAKYINPLKDVDGITQSAMCDIYTGQVNGNIPCTALAVMEILKDKKLEGVKVVVLGRSLTIGKPVANLLEQRGAMVTVCHSKVPRSMMVSELKQADVIVSAIGIPKYITGDMISNDQILIDVGINFDVDGKMCGDFDFKSCVIGCESITPVPFGVGTLTTLCLIENILKLESIRGGVSHGEER